MRAMMLGKPRFLNGTFNYTDPRHCSVHDPLHSTCFLNAQNHDGFYEGSPIVVCTSRSFNHLAFVSHSLPQYTQYVPQDNAKLIELQGGNEKFIDRLNFIFDEDYFDSTDEPSQQIPFMYHYADQPAKSTRRAREVISQSFNTSLHGLPGNDGKSPGS